MDLVWNQGTKQPMIGYILPSIQHMTLKKMQFISSCYNILYPRYRISLTAHKDGKVAKSKTKGLFLVY